MYRNHSPKVIRGTLVNVLCFFSFISFFQFSFYFLQKMILNNINNYGYTGKIFAVNTLCLKYFFLI